MHPGRASDAMQRFRPPLVARDLEGRDTAEARENRLRHRRERDRALRASETAEEMGQRPRDRELVRRAS